MIKPRPAASDQRKSLGFSAGMGWSSPMPESHAHGDLELNFVYRGEVSYFIGGRFVEVPENRLCAFWAAMSHQTLELAEGTEFMWLTIPLVTLLRWNLGRGFLKKVLGGELVLEPKGSAADVELTRRWVEDLAKDEPTTTRTVELEVEARMRRLAFQRVKTAPSQAEHRSRQQAEAIAGFLLANYQEELAVADVGQAVNLHPNSAMTVFRRECGMSIWQYVTRLRLAHAQLLLLSTDKTTLAVALESGFGSLARFYAAFKKECGVAPGEYRKRAL